MNTLEQMANPNLYGALPAYQDLKSWHAWTVVLKALHGLPLANEAELKLFRQCTGRYHYNPPPGGYPELVIIVGVQSGKSSIAGVLLGSAALTGESGTHAVGICQDHRGAMRVLLRYAREPFETLDMFKAEVARDTADMMELRNGVSLSAYPCKPQAVRGIRACIVVIDELAFFTTTDGRPIDREMLRVARGRVATTGGKIVVISSPYAQAGALWDLHRKHFGQEDSSTLIWQASAPLMNPTLPANYLERMAQDDPEAYRSEVLGEFRAGTSTFFDPEMIAACVDTGVYERVPQPQTSGHCTGGFDGGGGRVDAAVAVVAKVDSQGRAVLCAVRVWKAPFNPSGVIAEASQFFKRWGVLDPFGDAYAAEYTPEQFRVHGLTYQPSPFNRSEIYLELLPLVNSQSVVLLDHAELLRELRGLERRRGASGKDKVDHRRGSHDDIANASALALVMAAATSQQQPSTIKLVGW